MQSINFSHYRNIVVLTGAGVSAASGIRPFRGQGGLWNEIDPLEYSDCSLLETNPMAIWQLYGALRKQLETAQLNAVLSQKPANDKVNRTTLTFLPSSVYSCIIQVAALSA